jgi:NADH:ubiquinone oxidoreductase subunit 5 (subunit L)/multisubunit Na+/H+ antiporter MnhA subunit
MKNVGKKDAAIRYFLAALIIAAAVYLSKDTVSKAIMFAVAVGIMLTARYSFCPIYKVFGIKTNKKD